MVETAEWQSKAFLLTGCLVLGWRLLWRPVRERFPQPRPLNENLFHALSGSSPTACRADRMRLEMLASETLCPCQILSTISSLVTILS